jgi:hypothetical protein
MSPDEARELFSDAYEKSLAVDQMRAFESALQAHVELADEYAAFCRTLELMRQRPQPTPPNLLPGIQRRLKMNKRGETLRKRFGMGGVHPVALGLLMLALAGLAWVAFQLLQTSVGR